jgi:diguanylate cyclase (GGDEF)-like protein
VLIDIDLFKNINDTEGHLRGDKAIVEVAKCLSENVRPDDLVCRVGGDEFIILLECDGQEAHSFALRIKESLDRRNTEADRKIPITVSMGVAEYRTGEDAGEVIERADKALYKSKQNGRNNITVAS